LSFQTIKTWKTHDYCKPRKRFYNSPYFLR